MIKTSKNYFLNTMLPSIFYGMITGLITGAVIWAYSFLAEELVSLSRSMYEFVNKNLAFLPLLLAVLVLASLISYFNTKITPEAKGGGVPYIEGAARGVLPMKWYKVIPSAIIGSFLSFFCGLPLGSEGPSVLIGGAIGGGVNFVGGKYDKKRNAWRKLSITAGASAGFATALNAPLAGILFALEECHKKFSPIVMLTASISVLFSIVTSGLLRLWTGMGERFLFDFSIQTLSVPDLYLPLIAGIVAGFAATGFLFLLFKSKKLTDKIKIHPFIKIMAAFLLSGIACFFFADMIGGGSVLIRKLGAMQLEWKIILVLFVLKLILIVFCSSVGVSGGMFIPFLCLGALIGGLLANLMILCGMSQTYYSTIIVITMCAFLGSVLKAPITAVVLIVELSGSAVSSLLVSLLAIVAAYLITELFHTKPVYDEMLEGIIARLREGKEIKTIKLQVVVKEGSYAIGKVLRDILFPPVVTSVIHKDASGKDAKVGEHTISSGDIIIVEASTIDEQSIKNYLSDIFETTHEKSQIDFKDLK